MSKDPMPPLVTMLLLAALGAAPWAAAPAAAASRPIAPTERARALDAAFVRMAKLDLWPGFDPTVFPLAVWDGTATWLFRHPAPPEGFLPVAGAPGVTRYPGRHGEMRANTSTDLGGKTIATVMASEPEAEIEPLAAVAIHETFHAHQRTRHRDWSANEGALFTYPVEDAPLLAARRLESEAFRRALEARGDAAARWAAAALAVRRDRYAAMPAEAVAYERGNELNEGLATYVQYRARGDLPKLPVDGFATADVRLRAYPVGASIGLLLDRFATAWRDSLERGPTRPLDAVLDSVLRARRTRAEALPAPLRAAIERDAARDIARLGAVRDSTRAAFLGAPGWTIEVIAGAEPLWPAGFDPWNVNRLGAAEVLHGRWIKVSNAAGAIEVLDRASLTEAAGAHPLFNGIRRIVVSGLDADPPLVEKDGHLALAASGVTLDFAGARLAREGRTLRITLPAAKP